MQPNILQYCVVVICACFTINWVVAEENNICKNGRPNIVFIMADDAGFNDVSFHGSPQIPTPNIDALGLSGIILNQYYGSPLCTPTRGAVMTGKHPIHLRLQHWVSLLRHHFRVLLRVLFSKRIVGPQVVMGGSAEGLPLHEHLLPEYLREIGYSTHLVGKWHLGHARKAYLPTERGFDSHYGYWLGKQDYYDHYSNDGGKWGYDFRSNLSLHFDAMGKYDTDLFTNEAVRLIKAQPLDKPMFLMINHIAPHSANEHSPLQAPIETVDKFNLTIEDSRRRAYAAMVDKLDESVGLVVDELAKSNLLQNTVIVFASDNGAAPEGYDINYGSNWPLRGVKNTLWEGGTRLSALIWSPHIQNRVSYDLMHAHDWLPTIYQAAGCNSSKFTNIDGVSLWKTFTDGVPSPRKQMLYNIDDIYNNSAVRSNQWKLIQGNISTNDVLGRGRWDSWYGPSGRSESISVSDLIFDIVHSTAGQALQRSGYTFNETKILELQKAAEVLCSDPSITEQSHFACDPYNSPCLFNLEDDPCEKRNLADAYPEIVERLQNIIKEYNKTALTPIARVVNPNSDPKKWHNVWTTFMDNTESGTNPDFPDFCGSSNSIFVFDLKIIAFLVSLSIFHF